MGVRKLIESVIIKESIQAKRMGGVRDRRFFTEHTRRDRSKDKGVEEYVSQEPKDIQQDRKQNPLKHISLPLQRIFL